MRTDAETCHPATVSRFYDRELDRESYDRVKKHIDTCRKCRTYLSNLAAISEHVKGPLAEGTAGLQPYRVEEGVLAAIQEKQRPWWENTKERLLSKAVLIPATALVSLCLLMFVLLRSPAVSGPSAIITSLSGDAASIVIMETPETGHTILWFTEDS